VGCGKGSRPSSRNGFGRTLQFSLSAWQGSRGNTIHSRFIHKDTDIPTAATCAGKSRYLNAAHSRLLGACGPLTATASMPSLVAGVNLASRRPIRRSWHAASARRYRSLRYTGRTRHARSEKMTKQVRLAKQELPADRSAIALARFDARTRAAIRPLLTKRVISEHKRNPLGDHNDALKRVLNYFRRSTTLTPYVLVCTRPYLRLQRPD